MATQERHNSKILKKVFLAYPYYWPHYKAGGPVQSLYNLCFYFKNEYAFYLISSDKDIDDSTTSEEILLDNWNTGPNGEQIFYTSMISWKLFGRLLAEIKPDLIYVNGMFNINTTLPCLYYGKRLNCRIVISPRGMLQAWGLLRSKWTKKIFLKALALFLAKKEVWHATDLQEEEDIHRHFGNEQIVHIASNIPRTLSAPHAISFEEGGKIKLVFLSLINPNKNLHLIIDALHQLNNDRLSLDVYGPIIHKEYWALCEGKLTPSSRVAYKGAILPWVVPETLQHYHFFILPTQGENFGHAIFDSLSAGVPVAISKNTPWMQIDEKQAGFYFETITVQSIVDVLKQILDLSVNEYQQYRSKGLGYATDYLSQKDYKKEYSFLSE